MATGKWRNVHRSDPCEICGKGDWCSRSDDGAWALCRRVDAGAERRLDRAGSEYWLHLVGDAPKRPPQVPEEPRSALASAEDLDRVYGAVIRHLGLADQHREELLRRGLDSAAIENGGYRSLPQRGRAEIARELLARFPQDLLLSVPGLQLHSRQNGQYLSFGGPAGILVPVRDVAGRVVALKVRRDAQDSGPKYLYISSTACGGPGRRAQASPRRRPRTGSGADGCARRRRSATPPTR